MPIQTREDLGTDLYARDFETELFVRMPERSIEWYKNAQNWGSRRRPGNRREDTYDLGSHPNKVTRDIENELFVRMPEPPPEWAHRRKGNRREDTYDLWERMDLDELE